MKDTSICSNGKTDPDKLLNLKDWVDQYNKELIHNTVWNLSWALNKLFWKVKASQPGNSAGSVC